MGPRVHFSPWERLDHYSDMISRPSIGSCMGNWGQARAGRAGNSFDAPIHFSPAGLRDPYDHW